MNYNASVKSLNISNLKWNSSVGETEQSSVTNTRRVSQSVMSEHCHASTLRPVHLGVCLYKCALEGFPASSCLAAILCSHSCNACSILSMHPLWPSPLLCSPAQVPPLRLPVQRPPASGPAHGGALGEPSTHEHGPHRTGRGGAARYTSGLNPTSSRVANLLRTSIVAVLPSVLQGCARSNEDIAKGGD